MQFNKQLAGALTAGAALIGAAVVMAPANSVDSKAIKDGSVWQGDVAPAVDKVYKTTYYNTVGDLQLTPEMRAKVELGSGYGVQFAPKTIAFIGGSYFDPSRGFTTVGSFPLTKGKWEISTQVRFSRNAAGAAGVRPQIGLRVGQAAPSNFGEDFGTVGGVAMSEQKNKQLWGSSVATVEVAGDTTVGVYGHGFADSQGTADGEIDAAVNVSIVKVG